MSVRSERVKSVIVRRQRQQCSTELSDCCELSLGPCRRRGRDGLRCACRVSLRKGSKSTTYNAQGSCAFRCEKRLRLSLSKRVAARRRFNPKSRCHSSAFGRCDR